MAVGKWQVELAVGSCEMAVGSWQVELAVGSCEMAVGKWQMELAVGSCEMAVGSWQVELAVGRGQVELAVGRRQMEMAVGRGELAVGRWQVELAVGRWQMEMAVGRGQVELAVGCWQMELAVGRGQVELAVGCWQVELAVGSWQVELAVGRCSPHSAPLTGQLVLFYQILLRNSQRNVSRDFLEMRHYLERQEGGALWRIRQEQDAAQREMQDSVATVTAEISQLRERKAHLEEKLQYDWLDLLKSEGTVCESGTQHPCPLGDPQHLFDCNRIVETTQVISEMKLSLLAHPLLEEAPCPPPKLMEEEFGVPSEEPAAGQPPMPVSPARAPQNLLQWARKVWFDPQTVSSRLSLSSNNKTVTVTAANQHYPEGPLRFKVSQVLCAQSFSSGCCYWQVCARQGASWGIGVACAEIERTHRLGRNHLSWCVEWAKGGLSAWHSDQGIGLPGAKPQLVGVFLDCEAKLLSFYSGTGDSQVLLHSYRIRFSSRLFPAVWLFGLSRGTSLTITDPTSREPDG
uniref:B30.2/SPRY domain-containing protein n=1 Tax=Xenopus tropicalis TaxID=8364 RepID=A0A803JT14_XENTR